MKTFKRKTFYTAVLAAMGAMGVAGSANAVQLSQDGTGQVLIYPYYTTRTAGAGDFATYLNVTNTTSSFKAVKVRFLEGKNSREVLDFNLYLSPFDVWTGAVTKTTDGAKLNSVDKSCVTSAGGYAAAVTAGQIYPEFVNYGFIGASTDVGVTNGIDGEDQSLDRVREGYFEIIEMGTITATAITTGLKHNSAGTPANCAVVNTINNATGGVGNNFIEAPTGGLIGGASLINVLAGSDYGYDAVALEDFYQAPAPGNDIWSSAGNILPDMTKASPQSNVFYYHTAAGAPTFAGAFMTDVLTTNWSRGVDAVSAVLMRDSVMNSFVLDTATLSATDWVVTFPTKRHYVSANAPGSSVANDPNGTQRLAPFHNFFWTGGSCDPVSVTVWNREEGQITSNIEASPPKPGSTNNLCWEANVITFKNQAAAIADASTLLGSKNRLEVNTQFENGWAKLTFGSPLPIVGTAVTVRSGSALETYNGLPVVGFMAQDFLNTGVTIGGLPSASAYGGNFIHKYTRNISLGGVTP